MIATQRTPAPMPKSWLRPNSRLLLPDAGFLLLAIGACIGVAFWLWPGLMGSSWFWAAIGVSGVLAVITLVQLQRKRPPRVRYSDGALVLLLHGDGPVNVPVDLVECFFLGQTETRVAARKPPVRCAAIVVRLAERAEQYKRGAIDPTIGKWCDGYITISGAYTEPINSELIHSLNRWLVEAHRENRADNNGSQA